MTFHNQRRPYFIADIEPTIAVAEAQRWERESIAPRETLVVAQKMEEARVMRAAYQYELIRRCVLAVTAWVHRPRAVHAPAIVPQRRS